jgi:hypothetical protein
MISPNRRQLYGFALALVLGQRVVQAQAALTFEQLTGILKANDRVVVTADTGQNTKGRVVAAAAQESAASFDALAGRIQVGQRIWVTDTAGRESSGRVERLSSDGLVLKANRVETFTASEIRRVRAREHDSLKNGTLIGLGMGGGMGTVWCIAANADDSGDIDAGVECAEGFIRSRDSAY